MRCEHRLKITVGNGVTQVADKQFLSHEKNPRRETIQKWLRSRPDQPSTLPITSEAGTRVREVLWRSAVECMKSGRRGAVFHRGCNTAWKKANKNSTMSSHSSPTCLERYSAPN
jgi:hypothetical protein